MIHQLNTTSLALWLQEKPGITASCWDEAVKQSRHRFQPRFIDDKDNVAKSMEFINHETSFDGIAINYLQYGPEVEIEDLKSFYVLQIPLAGGVEITYFGQKITSNPSRPVLISPGNRVRERWKSGTQQIIISIDKSLVIQCLQKRFGKYVLKDNWIFEPIISAKCWPLQRVIELLKLLSNEDRQVGGCSGYDPTPIIKAIVETMVGGFDIYPEPGLSRIYVRPMPGHLSRFLNLLNDPKMLSLPVSELALNAGTTDRTLRNSAKRFLQASPHELIVRRRLHRARQMLCRDDLPIKNVAAIVGYSNAGRFSKAYRSFFGHLPSRADYLR